MAGCGCKGSNNDAQTQAQTQEQVQQAQAAGKQAQTEGIKAAIKKTVEKYYNVNKKTI
jgi:hypothetical protein